MIEGLLVGHPETHRGLVGPHYRICLLRLPPTPPGVPKARNQMSHCSIWGQFCCSHFNPVP